MDKAFSSQDMTTVNMTAKNPFHADALEGHYQVTHTVHT